MKTLAERLASHIKKKRRIQPPDAGAVIQPPNAGAEIPLAPPVIQHGADVQPAVRHAQRGPNVPVRNRSYTIVNCRTCSRVIGRYKCHPNPGNRDAPSWFLSVFHEGKFADTKYASHLKQVRVCHQCDEETVVIWIRTRRTACACPHV